MAGSGSRVKVVFIGNSLGGDDGIGPRLYNEFRTELDQDPGRYPALQRCELLEMGVIGLDLLNYVGSDDRLVIIDAVHTTHPDEVGDVLLLREDELVPSLKLVSMHDFGVENTTQMLRAVNPELPPVHVIGIKVRCIAAYHDYLSPALEEALPTVKSDVIEKLQELLEQ